MFERFTAGARTVVIIAQEAARESGSREIEPQHLLVGLAQLTDGESDGRFLARLGIPDEIILAEIDRFRRRGGVSDADAEALSELGIDVEKIVESVERTHGRGALANAWSSWRRGHIPFSDEAKKVIAGSLRESLLDSDNHIGAEHLLLALAARPGAAAELLARRGFDYETLRRMLGQREAG